jgi:glycine/D-amino acid oxidase-like deaminating enzyme
VAELRQRRAGLWILLLFDVSQLGGVGSGMQSWWPDGAGVVVKTAKGVYRARKLVLTAGAWLPDIVPQLQVGAVEALAIHDGRL